MAFPWKSSGVRILSSALLIYALVCAGMFLIQRRMIFFPGPVEPNSTLTPWEIDGKILGFHRRVEDPEAVWLLMHGNAGDASGRGYVLRVMSDRDSLYVLQYPGYGGRSGSPSKRAINQAAEEAYLLLRESYPDVPICVAGESIGSGPACHLTSLNPPPDKVTLMVPFDRLVHVASNQFPLLPVGLLLRDRWDNIDALQDYPGPVEIYGAEEDQVIPMMHAKILANETGAEFIMIEGGHNEWSYSPDVRFHYVQNRLMTESP